MKQVKTLSDLTSDLAIAYSQLRNKEITLEEAKETANLSGKLIKSACAQLKYQEFLQDKTPIPFFNL